MAALIDLFFLWFFTDLLHIYYLISQVLAFMISFTFGFYFQKYLTFRNYEKKKMKQATYFLVFQLIWLVIGLIILKASVEYVGIHYLLGAVIAKWVVFLRNYFMNKKYNFTA